jgi:hypothetical protein
MIFYKESKNFLSKESKNFIENFVLKDEFPLYKINTATHHTDDEFFSHMVLKRPENRSITETINSNYHKETLKILEEFLNSIKIKPSFYLRICYNVTFNNGHEKSNVHLDHDFSHKQAIIYLNEPKDKKSNTVILHNKKVYKEITPEKYKGICFENTEHYSCFPKFGSRYILVATFI